MMAQTMQTDGKMRKTIIYLAQILMAAGMIINCNSMYITLAPHDELVKRVTIFMMLAGAGIAILATGALRSLKRIVIAASYTGVLALYLLFYLFKTNYEHRIFVRSLILFLALLVYYLLVEENEKIPGLLLRYEILITAVAVFSLVCWLVFSILKLVPSSGYDMTWWNGTDHYTKVTTFFHIYFEPQTKRIFGMQIARNCGFFAEAPMASLHFSLGLLINLFLRKKTSKVRAVIMIAAILTTFSSTGYLVLAVGLLLKLLLVIVHSKRYLALSIVQRRVVKAVLIVVIAGIAVVCYVIVNRRVGGESWRIREEDMRAAFLAWFDHPVFGNGFYNFSAVKAHFDAGRAANPGYSSTTALGTILADGGLMFGLLYVGSFLYAAIRAIRRRDLPVLFFAVLVFVLFTVTIVPYEYIVMFLFLFFGLYQSPVRNALEQRLQ